MAQKQSLLRQQLKELAQEGTSTPYTLSLADLVMMQMAGDFTAFLDVLPKNGKISEGNVSEDDEQADDQQAHDRSIKSKDSFAPAAALIAKTKEGVTTTKLFPSIVEKTIEAQFGEKHAALRELPQNALDAYEPHDIKHTVQIDLEKSDKHYILHVRDYGCGMNLSSLVRDLLIPYNSGKEFDPTKIGEHGIGWYSVVDLAEVVKVISRTREAATAVQALIYHDKKNKDWKATILPQAKNGFARAPEVAGTEVRAFISHKATSPETIRDALYQYVGMVDSWRDGTIVLGEEVTNTLSREYQQSSPVPITINKEQDSLRFGVSNRIVKGKTNDIRFKHRDQNLDKILFTQRGLFVKYESMPFSEKSIQAELAKEMMSSGLDFWVDLPAHVTLTKGRNDIVADHQPLVLEALYHGFENVFLDVLLEDPTLMQVHGGSLLESIARLFDRTYAQVAKSIEENKYSQKRRVIAKTARIGSKIIDIGSYLGYGLANIGAHLGGGLRDIGRHIAETTVDACHYLRHDFSKDLAKAAVYIHAHGRELARTTAKAVAIGTPSIGVLGGILYGTVLLYDRYGFLVPATGMGLAGTLVVGKVGQYAYKNRQEIGTSMRESMRALGRGFHTIYERLCEEWRETDFRQTFSDLGEMGHDGSLGLLHKMGLYVNIEEKRQRKREKRIKGLTRKYMSSMYKDEFLRKIMHKNIIPATYYYSPAAEHAKQMPLPRVPQRKSWFASLSDIIVKEVIQGKPPSLYDYYRPQEQIRVVMPTPELEEVPVKLSIDRMVEIHLDGKLVTTEDTKNSWWKRCAHGEYLVDSENPLVHTVVDRLRQIKTETANVYNVKVLEDHLDNISGVVKSALLNLYLMSPPGLIHMSYALMCEDKKDLSVLSGSSMYGWIRKKVEGIQQWYTAKNERGPLVTKEQMKRVARTSYDVGKGVVIWTGKAAYRVGELSLQYVLMPVLRTTDPRRYPSYGRTIYALGNFWIENIQAEAEVRRKKKEEERKIALTIPQDGHQESVPAALWDFIQSAYRRAFGYGVFSGDSFDNVGKHQLQRLTAITSAGQSYLTYMNVIEALDKVVCDALKLSPVTPRLQYKKFKPLPDGMSIDNKGRLHLDASAPHDQVQALIPSRVKKSNENWEQTSTAIGYTLLDLLIHQRTHQALQVYGHKSDSYGHPGHPAHFYDQKMELQRKVVAYLLDHRVAVGELVRQQVHQAHHDQIFYHLLPETLADDLRSTRGELRDRRVQYEMRRQEIIAQQEKEMLTKVVLS